MSWPIVPLSDVLKLERRWVELNPTETYQEIGVRSFGNGVFHKTPTLGSTLGSKRVLRIEPGDLIFNNVFAWEGAVAVASQAEAGMIGSHRFITYTVDTNRSTPEYMRLFFTTEAGRAILLKASPGSAGRNKTLGLERFLTNSIPLPSIDEQRHLVTKIHSLTIKIQEATKILLELREDVKRLKWTSVSQVIESLTFDGRLGDVLLDKPRNGWSAKCDGLDTGTPVLSLGAVTGYRYRPNQFKWTSEATYPTAHYWLKAGDLLITRSNTPELVGHAAIYNGQPINCIYPDLMMRLNVNERLADKRFVLYLLRSGRVREYIQRNANGSSPTMKKITQGTVLGIPFPSKAGLPIQAKIVEEIDKLEERMKEVSILQNRSAAELEALLPAILNQAFQGQLS